MGFFETGGKAAKFQTPGDSITGTITRPYREAQVTKYGTTEPDFWSDGSPKMQAIIDLQTDAREDGDDDGVRTLYVASTRQRRALADAIKRAGARDLEEGGKLTLTYTGNDPKSKNPQNPAKMYSAVYEKPAARVGLLGQAAAAPEPPAQAAPAPTAAPTSVGGLTPEQAAKARELFGLGLDSATVSAALGSTIAAVEAAKAA